MLRRLSGENQPWGEVSSAIHLSWWTPLFRGDLSRGKDLLAPVTRKRRGTSAFRIGLPLPRRILGRFSLGFNWKAMTPWWRHTGGGPLTGSRNQRDSRYRGDLLGILQEFSLS